MTNMAVSRLAALASTLLLAGAVAACTPAGPQQGQSDPNSAARLRGAKLAGERCEACHGAAGIPVRPDIPDLGGNGLNICTNSSPPSPRPRMLPTTAGAKS
jgi:mono/diheme cytochrome c family protein